MTSVLSAEQARPTALAPGPASVPVLALTAGHLALDDVRHELDTRLVCAWSVRRPRLVTSDALPLVLPRGYRLISVACAKIER